MVQKTNECGEIVFNVEIADGIYWMSVNAPLIASLAQPGQFVHVKPARGGVQFLRMPFAIYDTDADGKNVEIVYQTVGEGTQHLTMLKPGELIDLIGPIGNGWSPAEDVKKALLVGGGVGTPALNLLARKLASSGAQVDVVIGAANKDKLACVDRLTASAEPSGGSVKVTTDDGSCGVHGFVTAISDKALASGEYDYLAVCGPTPMMRNVVRPALEHEMTTQVSMEKLMACGVGACLSCIVETTAGRKRCCVDGPVFNAEEVVW